MEIDTLLNWSGINGLMIHVSSTTCCSIQCFCVILNMYMTLATGNNAFHPVRCLLNVC